MDLFMKITALIIIPFFFCGCTKNKEKIEMENNVLVEMVLIPAGTFTMGNTGVHTISYATFDKEKPIQSVTISRDFFMSKYEITQKQYEAVMGTNPSHIKSANLPVEQISWYDAIDFCNKLSDLEGLDRVYSGSGTNLVCDWNANGYRLPTEAEWEYAAKAGTLTDFYGGDLTDSWCEPIDINLDRIGWYCGNSGYETQPVGLKYPNDFGLFDISGNVWEWCWDWYEPYSNKVVIDQNDPKGAESGENKIIRGGSSYDAAQDCISNSLGYTEPKTKNITIGFRIVKTKH